MNLVDRLRKHPEAWRVAKILKDSILPPVWAALDAGESLIGKKDKLTPPRRLMEVGSNSLLRNDFNAIGDELFRYLVDVGGLKPDDKVLDVGCGIGRMAIPLTRYLSASGSYDGIDIVKPFIDYCVTAYADHPTFHFHHSDAYNGHFNPNGSYQSHEYRFPFEDGAFSFVFLTSVFTHMYGRDVEQYLSEIRRVLRPGGTCFATFFLLNDAAEERMKVGTSQLRFQHPIDHGKVLSKDNPEAAVAFNESYVRSIYASRNFVIKEPIRMGSWSGAKTEVGHQDIVIATAT